MTRLSFDEIRAAKTKRTKRRNRRDSVVLAIPRPGQVKREVDIVRFYRDGRERINVKTATGKFLYRSRTIEMAERQGWLCAICNKWMTTYDVTFDHINLRGKFHDDRIEDADGKPLNRAVHGVCNSERGSKRGN